MGVSEKFERMGIQIQDGIKSASLSIFGVMIKSFTAFVIGVTIAMIGQEVFEYQTLSFVFMLILTFSIIYRIMFYWSISSVLVFDFICLLVAILLRNYILFAP